MPSPSSADPSGCAWPGAQHQVGTCPGLLLLQTRNQRSSISVDKTDAHLDEDKTEGGKVRNESLPEDSDWDFLDWDDEADMENCCEYEKFVGKRLRGTSLARPRDDLKEAQDLCDQTLRCKGVVRLGHGRKVPEAYRGKFAIKGGENITNGTNDTVLYKRVECSLQKTCVHEKPEQNVTNATNATSNASNVSSGCVTRLEPRAASWVENVAPPGTPCVFGADDNDEGGHCIFDAGKFGSFGWCHTKLDRSSWGSCSEGCPLFGHQKLLGEKLDGVADAMQEVQGFLREKFGDVDKPETNATAPPNATAAPAKAPPAPAQGVAPAPEAGNAPPAATKVEAPPPAAKGTTASSAV